MQENLFLRNKIILNKNIDISDNTIEIIDSFYKFGIENKYHEKSLPLILLPFFYTIGIIISKLFIFINNSNKISNKEGKYTFIFITTFQTIIRCSKIKDIAPNNLYGILYLPSFNFKEIIRHIKYHKHKNSKNIFYGTFRWKSILLIWWQFLKLISNKFDISHLTNRNERRYFYKLIMQYVAYESFYKTYISNIEKKNEIKWFFDYDKSIFIPIIDSFKKDMIKTNHFQHGIFLKPNKFYIPLLCENVICCSEREKKHYQLNGINEKNIFLLGAPLQSLIKIIKDNNDEFDLLVLLTSTIDEDIYQSQLYTIKFLKEKYYHNKKILFRFRPASKEADFNKLKKELTGFDISKNNSLIEDISKSKAIISFSVDSIFNIQANNIPYIIITKLNEIDKYTENVILSTQSKNFELSINNLLNKSIKSSINNEEFIKLFGEFRLKYIKRNFKSILNQL